MNSELAATGAFIHVTGWVNESCAFAWFVSGNFYSILKYVCMYFILSEAAVFPQKLYDETVEFYRIVIV